MGNPQPEHVFSPKTVVSPEMFETRNEPDLRGVPGLQDRLVDALQERGCQVVVYGDTGVGKSSLVNFVADRSKRATLEIECKSGMSFLDLVNRGEQQVVSFKQVGRTKRNTIGAELHVEAQVPWFARLKSKIRGEAAQEDVYEVVEKSPFNRLIAGMSKVNKTLLVLENFQNIDLAETRTQVAQHMEELSDAVGKGKNPKDIKIVVIGIATDPAALIGTAFSYGRRIEQVGVPRMPDDEIREVISRGMKILGLTIETDQVERLTFFSDGFPYFAHLLGLYISNAVLRSDATMVSDSIIDVAISRAAQSVAGSHAERIRVAYERGGAVQPRKRIIQLLAASNEREWTSGEITLLWQQTHPDPDRSGYAFINVALGQLIADESGKILTRSGSAGRFVYRFSDPHIRPFVRITERIIPVSA